MLLIGNDGAAQPVYDLGAQLEHEDWDALGAMLERLVPNVAYAENRPPFERYPQLLPTAFVAATIGLLAFAFTIVRGVSRRRARRCGSGVVLCGREPSRYLR